QDLDLELVRIGQITLDNMAAADADTDNGDIENLAHCAHSVPRSAICWAVSASFMALKHRSCGMAVSVRLRTSSRNCRPKGRSTLEQSICCVPFLSTRKRWSVPGRPAISTYFLSSI